MRQNGGYKVVLVVVMVCTLLLVVACQKEPAVDYSPEVPSEIFDKSIDAGGSIDSSSGGDVVQEKAVGIVLPDLLSETVEEVTIISEKSMILDSERAVLEQLSVVLEE